MDLNFQSSQIQQQTINASEQGAATQTVTYAVPPEHQAAVEEVTRKIDAEIQKPEPSVQTILNDIMALAWKNTPAFLAMLKMWMFK